MSTLKPQDNGQLYSNMVIDTLAVDGWAVTFGTAHPSVEEWIWHYNCLCTLKGQVNMLCGELR